MGYFEELIGVNLWTALFTLLNTLTVIFVGTIISTILYTALAGLSAVLIGLVS